MARKIILRAGGGGVVGSTPLIVTPAPAIVRAFARGLAALINPPSEPPPGANEPFFGDNAADVLIWESDFDGYSDLTALKVDYSVVDGAGGGNLVEMTAVGGGRGGTGRAVHAVKNNATQGYVVKPKQGFGSPTHFFGQYWFKMTRTGRSFGKWVIMHHNAEGGGILRDEYAMATQSSIGTSNQPYERFLNRGENAGQNGPQNGESGFFVWVGTPNADTALPVFTADPAWNLSPLNPANGGAGQIADGNWHRHTTERKTGSGTAGYHRLWLDGHLYWDSTTSTQNLLGNPTTFEWATVSASSGDPYEVWYDDQKLWKRA